MGEDSNTMGIDYLTLVRANGLEHLTGTLVHALVYPTLVVGKSEAAGQGETASLRLRVGSRRSR